MFKEEAPVNQLRPMARWLRPLLLFWVVTVAASACSSGTTAQTPANSAASPSTTVSQAGSNTSGPMATESTVGLSTGTTSGPSSLPKYDGPESKFLGEVPTPAMKPGTRFKVGFLQVNGAVGNLRAVEQAADAAVGKLGGSMVALDAQLNPQTQISQFQQLISQKVDAIIVLPAVDSSLEPSLKQAKDAGIPVFTYGLPVDKSKPADPFVTTSINVGFDYAAYSVMKDIATKRPGSTFAILGSALPVPTLQYIDSQVKSWGIRMGLKFLDEADALTDDTNGYGPAANSILTRHPDVTNLVAFNDESAVFAATQATQRGNSTVQISCINGGEDIARQAITGGRMYSDYFMRWSDLGTSLANAAYTTVTSQGTLPAAIVLKSTVVTKANVGEARSWAK